MIEASKDEASLIRVYDMTGRDVTALVKISGLNSTQAVLYLKDLVPGIYNIKTKTASHAVWKQ